MVSGLMRDSFVVKKKLKDIIRSRQACSTAAPLYGKIYGPVKHSLLEWLGSHAALKRPGVPVPGKTG